MVWIAFEAVLFDADHLFLQTLLPDCRVSARTHAHILAECDGEMQRETALPRCGTTFLSAWYWCLCSIALDKLAMNLMKFDCLG